jgi:hypothetical protein
VSVANGRMSERVALAKRYLSHFVLTCGSLHLSGKQLISHFLLLHCDLSNGPIGLADCPVDCCLHGLSLTIGWFNIGGPSCYVIV